MKAEEKKIAVIGIGGVGGYVCEALVRSESISSCDNGGTWSQGREYPGEGACAAQ